MARNIARFKRNVLAEYTEQKIKREERQATKRVIRRINVVNEMLRALKNSDLYDESVAVDNLFVYLNSETVSVSKTKKGYVSIRGISSKSLTSIIGINKAIDQFLKNQTHTVRGMKKLYEDRRDELKNYIDDEEFVNDLSMKDIKTIYSVFQSNQYERSSRSFDSKSFFTLYTQAIDEKWNKEKFLKESEYYMDFGSDEDLKEDISDINDKYISKYSNRE